MIIGRSTDNSRKGFIFGGEKKLILLSQHDYLEMVLLSLNSSKTIFHEDNIATITKDSDDIVSISSLFFAIVTKLIMREIFLTIARTVLMITFLSLITLLIQAFYLCIYPPICQFIILIILLQLIIMMMTKPFIENVKILR